MQLTSIILALLTQSAISSAVPKTQDFNYVSNPHDLPVIDLGYVKQRASSYNATGKYYNFTNIAFAQPPHITAIQDGNDKINPTCPQAFPAWLAEAALNRTDAPMQPYETEDCLYLDVLVPEKIFNKRHDRSALAPIMVWIHGGGFVIGSKTQNGDGSGLIARSLEEPDAEGIIFVAPNYRLGAFGWLGGSKFEKQGGSSNASLLDQRMALEWIQQNIAKFGGDPHRVTAMGESGGGGSIGQHLVAGRKGHQFDTCRTPLHQAIFQSPDEASPDFASDAIFNTRFDNFLTDLGVSDLKEAQSIDFSKVYAVNRATVAAYPGGSFTTFSLYKDGGYVVSNLNQGLAAGGYDHNIKIMTSHTAEEGYLFTATLDPPPSAANFSFLALVKQLLPSASPSDIHYISSNLYSLQKFGGSEMARTDAFQGELQIICNGYGLQRAFNYSGFAYTFAVPPAFHTADISYTLYSGRDSQGNGVDAKVAADLQRYLTQFAMVGNPNRAGLTPVPVAGQEAKSLQLNITGSSYISEPEIKKRCEYWETYHY